MSDNDPRIAAIRDALSGVPTEDLHKAASHLGGRWGALLDKVTAALESGDEDALGGALADLPDPDLLQQQLAPLRSALDAGAAALKSQLSAARSRLVALRSRRADLTSSVSPLREAAEGDAELLELLDEASAHLADDTPWEATDALVARLDRLAGRLEDLPADRDLQETLSVDLALEGAELEREAREVEQATQPLLEDVPRLLDRAADLAATRGHAVAPAAAIQAARVWEANLGMDVPEVVTRWQKAYDLSMANKQLEAVWIAGKRLQADAIRRNDFKRVAVLAHHMADLAYGLGARRRAVLARMEEAQCLARWPEHHEAARTYLGDAVKIAEAGDDDALKLQAGLMEGQTMEILGDDAEARRVYERSLRSASGQTPPSAVLGRIALQLGRQRLAAGQHHRAEKCLSLAHQAALAQGDAVLLGNVAVPQVELKLAHGDEDGAAGVLRGTLARLAGTDVVEVLLDHARERWGGERVEGWLGGVG